MAKISVIGICGNSVFLYVDHFHENGETLIADSVYEEIGGKGINQAVAAARMGTEVSFLAAIGDDADGRECARVAKEEKLNAMFRVKKGKTTTFAFILTDKNGENRVTEYKSAELTPEDVLAFEAEIAASDILLLQQEVSVEVNETAARIAAKYGVKVILNPAPARKISPELASSVYAVTPNSQEAKGLELSQFANCITTLGKDGCLINGEIKIPALEVEAVDTTGAGDTFNGGLGVCIAEGMDLETACSYAVTASGISVGARYVLNAIPNREDIEKMHKVAAVD